MVSVEFYGVMLACQLFMGNDMLLKRMVKMSLLGITCHILWSYFNVTVLCSLNIGERGGLV